MLSQALKEYRAKHHITQEQLAAYLYVEPRTIRRWETQETILRDRDELRRIASKLGIASERLGVTSASINEKQADETLEHIWKLVEEGKAWEAREVAERLTQDLQTPADTLHPGSPAHLRRLTQAHHAAAYTKAMNSRNNEIQHPLASYHNMEETARLLDDPELISLALTYEGDMYNRAGKLDQGIEHLEAALTLLPPENKAARGNATQLLARGYFKLNKLTEFELHMSQAEEIAGQLTSREITKGQYGLISVYEEYAKSYALLGQMQKSLDYIQKARDLGTHGTHWEIVLKTAMVMALIRGGELDDGARLAVACVELCRQHGTLRLLERIYGEQSYLRHRSYDLRRFSDALKDALDGPAEY